MVFTAHDQRRRARRPVAALFAALALTGCAAASTAPTPGLTTRARLDPDQQRGHDFAVRRCGGCHNVGLDDGPPDDGPSFRTLSRRYTPLSLERRFAEVSAHGIDRMPPIDFTTSEARDLVAYFDTLQD